MNKAWYKSKTLWTNVIAIVGIIAFGKEFDVTTVGVVLTVINFILRLVTKSNVVWTE
jgi:hypothetical protein